MAIPTIPPGVDSEGRRKFYWTPIQTDSLAVITGATAIPLTCYLTKNTMGESAETERGTDERECTVIVFETLGKTTFTLENFEYVWDPQATASDPDNKAYDTLKPRTQGYLTAIYGLPYDQEPAAGDKFDQFPITVGEQVRKTPEGNAGEKLKITQEVVVTGQPVRDGILVA
jgi:hypothetical protein